MKLLALVDKVLGDPIADQVRRSIAAAIRQLQGLPCVDFKVIQGVELPDTVAITVPHKLGRAPIWVGPSAPRGGSGVGVIFHYTGFHPTTGAPINNAEVVVIAAFSYGATVTIDLAVA